MRETKHGNAQMPFPAFALTLHPLPSRLEDLTLLTVGNGIPPSQSSLH